MSPLRKGSRCHAPALCLSQWRGWVYATFHLWDKENHRSSCNGGIFRVFRAGGFDEINRRWRNFNYSNREVLDLPMGGRNKKENTEVFAVLPSWNDEKEERFLRQKVTVMTWKMVEKIWILSKNIFVFIVFVFIYTLTMALNASKRGFIFGESLTKCAPSGHEKTLINRKSREPFFKYGSLRLNDLSVKKDHGGVEEEREEDRGWGWESRRWKLDDRKEEWCYLLWECMCWLLGGFVNFLNWIELGGVHVCWPIFFNFFLKRPITCDVLNSCWESVPNYSPFQKNWALRCTWLFSNVFKDIPVFSFPLT